MSEQQPTLADYQEWQELAREPTQTGEMREFYRQKMNEYLERQLKNAFQRISDSADKPAGQ